jgi:hypothetical protein
VARESWPAMSRSLLGSQGQLGARDALGLLPPMVAERASATITVLAAIFPLPASFDAKARAERRCVGAVLSISPFSATQNAMAPGRRRARAKRRRRAAATHFLYSQMPDASGQSLQYRLSLPRKMPWHRAAGGHERKLEGAGERRPLTFCARRGPMRRGSPCSIAFLCHAKCHGTGPPAGTSEKAPASGGHSLFVLAEVRCVGAVPAVSLIRATQTRAPRHHDAGRGGRNHRYHVPRADGEAHRWDMRHATGKTGPCCERAPAKKALASGGHWPLTCRARRISLSSAFSVQRAADLHSASPLPHRCSPPDPSTRRSLLRYSPYPGCALRHTLQSSCLAHDDWSSSLRLSLRATLPVCSLWPSASASTLPPSCRG